MGYSWRGHDLRSSVGSPGNWRIAAFAGLDKPFFLGFERVEFSVDLGDAQPARGSVEPFGHGLDSRHQRGPHGVTADDGQEHRLDVEREQRGAGCAGHHGGTLDPQVLSRLTGCKSTHLAI